MTGGMSQTAGHSSSQHGAGTRRCLWHKDSEGRGGGAGAGAVDSTAGVRVTKSRKETDICSLMTASI